MDSPFSSLLFSRRRIAWLLAGSLLAGGAACTDQEFRFAVETPLSIVATLPAHGGVNVSVVDTAVDVQFSEPVTLTSLEDPNNLFFEALDPGPNPQGVPGRVTWRPETRTATFRPDGDLAFGTRYRLTLTEGIQRDTPAGGSLLQRVEIVFRTAEAPPLELLSALPAGGSEGVAADASLRLVFSREVSAPTLVAGFAVSKRARPQGEEAGGEPESVDGLLEPSAEEPSFSFVPDSPFGFDQEVRVTLAGEITALDGGSLQRPIEIVFFTAPRPALRVQLARPETGPGGVGADARVEVIFAELLDCDRFELDAEALRAAISLMDQGAQPPVPVAGERRCEANILAFDANLPYTLGHRYEVTVPAGLLGAAGEILRAPIVYSFDVVPPTGLRVLGATPPAGATQIDPASAVSLNFDQQIDPASIDVDVMTLRDITQGVDQGVPIDAQGGVALIDDAFGLQFVPAAGLGAGRIIQVRVAGTLQGLNGGTLGRDLVYSFSTAGASALGVVQVVPAPGRDGVDIDAEIAVSFTEAIEDFTQLADPSTFLRLLGPDGGLIATEYLYEAQRFRVRMTPQAALLPETTYRLEASDGIRGAASGRTLPAAASWEFTTAGLPALQLLSSSPTDAGRGVRPDVAITFIFDAPLEEASARIGQMGLVRLPNRNPVDIVREVDGAVLRLRPAEDLSYGTRYAAFLRGAGTPGALLRSQAGATLATDLEITLTVEEQPGELRVLELSPAPGERRVSTGAVLRATFDRELDFDTIDATRFYLTRGAVEPGAPPAPEDVQLDDPVTPQSECTDGDLPCLRLETPTRLALALAEALPAAGPQVASLSAEICAADRGDQPGGGGCLAADLHWVFRTGAEGLVINEVQPGVLNEAPFVEIVNAGTVALDLSNLRLSSGLGDAERVRHRFGLGGLGVVLQPGEAVVVFESIPAAGDFGGARLVESTGALVLRDDGDRVRLRSDPAFDNVVLAEFRYDAREGRLASLTRSPDVDGEPGEHDAANNPADPAAGALSSPGRRVDLSPF